MQDTWRQLLVYIVRFAKGYVPFIISDPRFTYFIFSSVTTRSYTKTNLEFRIQFTSSNSLVWFQNIFLQTS